MQDKPSCCVLIPYRDRPDMLEACLGALAGHLPAGTVLLLVDDGSTEPQTELDASPALKVLRHESSQGPAAARNTGIQWCRNHGIDIVILLDSDCTPGPDFVQAHIDHHIEHEDIVCLGGAIQGVGRGVWAHIDRVASWFTSIPGAPPREVGALYHIPTTNMSFKLAKMPQSDPLFDPALRTGEDVQFVNMLRAAGGKVMFFPTPLVSHRDREHAKDFLAHQYRWGRHTYVARFGVKHKMWQRGLVALAFLALLPAYACAAAAANLLPWLRVSKRYIVYGPILFVLFLFKGIGVLEGILKPESALFPGRGQPL